MEFAETGVEGMAMTNLAQDGYQCEWQAIVNTVMNFGFHKILGIS
jgi:hypothetical protein